MKKNVLIIGIGLGVLLTLFRVLDYFVLLKMMKFEYYAGAIGLIFLTLGIWAGTQLNKKQPIGSEGYAISWPKGKAHGLSERELDVLLELTNGLSNQEIADKLFVSLNTVKTHISNIYLKLHVKRRTQAVTRAKTLEIIA